VTVLRYRRSGQGRSGEPRATTLITHGEHRPFGMSNKRAGQPDLKEEPDQLWERPELAALAAQERQERQERHDL
jgi:hypothetical protein